MKKFILPLLVLLFVGSLFAVESDPSEVVGYVKYDLVAGLNLVALPLNNNYATTTDLSDAYPTITSIQKWTGNSWYAVNFDPDFGWDDEFALDNTSVLFVAAEGAVSMYSLGPVPASIPQFDLAVGLNTIFLPLNKSAITNTELLGMEIPEISSIQKWSGDSWYAVNYDPDFGWDDQFDLSIGFPIFVGLDSATAPWPSSGTRSGVIRTSK